MALPEEHVAVVVQARPLLPFEAVEGAVECLELRASPPTARVVRACAPDVVFGAFDGVYGGGSAGAALYDAHVRGVVDSVFLGVNGTVFAYGQTSAGKSYTMRSVTDCVVAQIFEGKRRVEGEGKLNVTVRVGFVEIYKETIRDLVDGCGEPLGTVEVQVRERGARGSKAAMGGVFLDGARERAVGVEDDLLKIIREGSLVRQTAATAMNASSSRSHSIITITVQQESVPGVEGGERVCLAAKLHLVDLAGSERAKRTAAGGTRFAEGVEINKGLFALAKVISALADASQAQQRGGRRGKRHVPYRDSKLTRLLQDSLGGNARTLLIACVSPADTSREETAGTLRYAACAKNIRNRPKVNNEANAVEISDLRAVLARSRAEVSALVAENQRLRARPGPARGSRHKRSASHGSDVARSGAGGVGSHPPSDAGADGSNNGAEQLGLSSDDVSVSDLQYRIAELELLLAQAKKTDSAALSGTGPGMSRRVTHSRARSSSAIPPQSGGTGETRGALRRKVSGSVSGAVPAHRQNLSRPGAPRKTRSTMHCGRGSGVEDDIDSGLEKRSGNQPVHEHMRAEHGPGRPLQQKHENNNAQKVGIAVAFGRRSVSAHQLPGRRTGVPRRPQPAPNSTQKRADAVSDSAMGDPLIAQVLSATRTEEMRRTFTQRLSQAEADKMALDRERLVLLRKLSVLQARHEKEVNELKATHESRMAGMRSKVADVKRLEGENTRMMKMRDTSDAARQRIAGKLKIAEASRDDMVAKLTETLARVEQMKRSLGKENRDLAKSERLLRVQMRRMEVVNTRQDSIVARLREENESLKKRLRDGPRGTMGQRSPPTSAPSASTALSSIS